MDPRIHLRHQIATFAIKYMEMKMYTHSNTADAPKLRTEKISAYVDPACAKYLRTLAANDHRKISATLDLILKEHMATAARDV